MANYPVPYQNNWNYSGVGQQMYPQYQNQSMMQTSQTAQPQHGPGLIWVDGEVGAKAYQLPAGLPANQPIALWDTNDTIIYLKSTNPMGMPNPLQKAHYTLEEYRGTGPAKSNVSGDEQPDHDMTLYVKKEDMERMKRELMEAINGVNTSGNQNTSGARKPAGQKGE